MTKLTTVKGIIEDNEKIAGWAFCFEFLADGREKIEIINGCSRETAIGIARRRNAVWAREFVVRGDERVIGC